MIDSLVLVDIKGEQIHQALENGVSQWPKLDGRFPQVGGITFAFDPTKPPGSRIDPAFIKIGTEYMDRQQHYKLATKAAMVDGDDGYTALSQGEKIHILIHLGQVLIKSGHILHDLEIANPCITPLTAPLLQEQFWWTPSAPRASPAP